ncbi:MAG: high potential iron sulfur protein [Alphaproteobacteria bacterium]|nr:high potential iron sulfur protein [Alphaproteobacteria bacterium]
MSKETGGPRGIFSRRALLQGTTGVIATVVALSARGGSASATIKISKAAVAYQDHPDGDRRCGKCLQFVMPASCKMVDGPISPQGYCRIFAPLRQA